MKIHDLSLPITAQTLVWPGDPPVKIQRVADQANGDLATVSALEFGSHTGTHLDAPLHFLPGGGGVETLPLDGLCGPAWVCDVRNAPALTAEVFEQCQLPAGVTRLLCHTRNSAIWAAGQTEFQPDYVAVTADGAAWLVAHGIRLIGVDYLSVAPYAEPVPSHTILLQAGVIPIEGLNLNGIAAGAYELYCLPLKLVGTDGAPVRAILVER